MTFFESFSVQIIFPGTYIHRCKFVLSKENIRFTKSLNSCQTPKNIKESTVEAINRGWGVFAVGGTRNTNFLPPQPCPRAGTHCSLCPSPTSKSAAGSFPERTAAEPAISQTRSDLFTMREMRYKTCSQGTVCLYIKHEALTSCSCCRVNITAQYRHS